MQFIQSALLAAYRGARRLGVFDNRLGKAAFEKSYWAYKSLIEAKDIRLLKPYVTPGSTVIDVGANIGFFTIQFVQWVGPKGHVIAIEPEVANFESLRTRIAREGFENRVDLVNAAALDVAGDACLLLNPDNPADHRVADSGTRIKAIRIDDLMEAKGWAPVSLVKVDVQGGELRVIRGARETLSRLRPALFVEFQESGLVHSGTSSRELLREIVAMDYEPHILSEAGAWVRASPDAIFQQMNARGYLDVLLNAKAASGVGQSQGSES